MSMQQTLMGWTDRLRRKRRLRELQAKRDVQAKSISIRKDKQAVCMNCGVQLTGHFCHVCGQRDNELRRPIWTFLMEILDNVFSSDSRLFKTLFVLTFMPGALTRYFMDGKRARFVMPLRLYISVSIVFFLLISIADVAILDIKVTLNEEQAAITDQRRALKQAKKDIAESEEVIKEVASQARPEVVQRDIKEKLKAKGFQITLEDDQKDTLDERDAEIAQAKKDIDEQLTALPPEARDQIMGLIDNAAKLDDQKGVVGVSPDGKQEKNLSLPYDIDVNMFVPLTDEKRVGLREEDIEVIKANKNMPSFVMEAALGFARSLTDPSIMNRLLNDWIPKAMLVLVPLFALLLRMFHWGRAHCLMNQLVFSLHFHT